jgi:DNA polymerase III delta' subunit
MLTFENILGQDRAIQTLLQAWSIDRLPHGLIFAGPPGVGKATTASALATLFLCEKPGKDRPCGKCASCRAFVSSSHPDYHVITKELVRVYDKSGTSKATTLSINVIRPELIQAAAQKPTMGRGKVFLIEEAELTQAAAQNAMLKTLEEPAGRTLIILLTDQPESLLTTIRSRCQTVRFASLDPKIVAKELQRRDIDASTAATAAELSQGSIGLALRWIEDGVIPPAQKLAEDMDRYLAGHGAADISDRLKAIGEAYAEKQLERDEFSSKDNATRTGVAMYLSLAAQRLRIRMQQSNDPALLDRACAAIDAMFQTEIYLGANVNIPVALQQLAATLSAAK